MPAKFVSLERPDGQWFSINPDHVVGVFPSSEARGFPTLTVSTGFGGIKVVGTVESITKALERK